MSAVVRVTGKKNDQYITMEFLMSHVCLTVRVYCNNYPKFICRVSYTGKMGSLMRGWLRGTQSSIRALTYCQARSIRSSAPVLSNENKKLDEEAVVLTDDGRVVVCWHPEVPVPYELTKPIPAEAMPTDATLKVQALMPVSIT